MVNWLVGDVPQQVFAYGALNYYGPNSPHRPEADNADPDGNDDPRRVAHTTSAGWPTATSPRTTT